MQWYCQAHDVVAAEVYGEDAVRVTPPPALATNLASTGDEVEGPNGECPPVSDAPAQLSSTPHWSKMLLEWYSFRLWAKEKHNLSHFIWRQLYI